MVEYSKSILNLRWTYRTKVQILGLSAKSYFSRRSNQGMIFNDLAFSIACVLLTASNFVNIEVT